MFIPAFSVVTKEGKGGDWVGANAQLKWKMSMHLNITKHLMITKFMNITKHLMITESMKFRG